MNPQTPKKSQHFMFDGKTYESFDDLPEAIKKKYDKDGNGVPDLVDFFEKNPLFNWINKNEKPDLEAIKAYAKNQIDPVKLNTIFEWIRGVIFLIGLLALFTYWISK